MTLDDIDLKILNLLLSDGRMSHTAIGKETNLSGPSVYARVQRLEREGIIRGYTALLAPEKVGHGLAAFVRIRTQTPGYNDEAFESFIRQEEQIVECHDIDGEDCYILKVRTASTQSLQIRSETNDTKLSCEPVSALADRTACAPGTLAQGQS